MTRFLLLVILARATFGPWKRGWGIVFAYAEDVSVGTEVFPPDVIALPTADDEEIAEVQVTRLARRHPDFIDMKPVFLNEAELTMNVTILH